MKFITGSTLLIFSLVLIWGCTANKDIMSEQSDAITASEVLAEDTAPEQTTTTTVGAANTVSDIAVSEKNNGDSQVFLYSQSKLNYTIFKLSKPDRIIIDIPDATGRKIMDYNRETALISAIRSSVLSDKGSVYLRVEIFLKNAATYTAQSQASAIQIDIHKKNSTYQAAFSSPGDKPALVKVANTSIGKSNLVDLQLQNQIPRYHSYALTNPARIVLELENTVNQLNQRSISIDENYITKIRFGLMPKGLKIVFDINERQAPDFKIRQKGDTLSIAMGVEAIETPSPAVQQDKAAAPPLPFAAAAQAPAEEVAPETEKPVQKPEPASSIYTGEKISLDFKDADLKNVLRLLGDISGINMTIGSKVAGKVTLKLENIPSDEALDIVLINNGLDKTVTPQYTRIDTVEQIKKFNDDRAQAKRSHEQAEDTVIKTFSISYAQAGNLATFIKKMNVLTPNRGSVNYFDLTNKLSVSDIPDVIAKVEKIILEQDIPTRQVMIESRVVQSAPSWVKDMGIAWGGTYTGHKGGDFATIPITGAAGNGQVVNLLGAANGAINIGYITDKYALDATLTALENEDKLKILSNPRILTLDNKESSIKQGVQLPYLKLNENGVTSTEFKDAVLEMKVKPKITAANTIAINIDVKKDQKSAQTGAGNEPGIDVRQITTDLLVESGKTVVIGGIYETTKSINVKKVPFFADLPLIGWAFRSKREEETLTEMLVFITVTIVESPNNVIVGSTEKKG